jgi:hypothetical protein
MASILKVDTIQDQSGNNIINESANTITIGASGDTITIPSGATFASVGIDDNATSTAITIDSNSDVGINNTNPTYRLDVIGGTYTAKFKGRIVNIDGASASDSPRLNLSLDGTDKAQLLFNRSNEDLSISNLTANDIQFNTNSAERMRIDSSGNVGIGNSIPGDFNANANNLVVGSGTGSEGMTIYSGSSDKGVIYFADASTGTGEYAGFVDYNHSDNALRFGTNNGSERMRIDSSGIVLVGKTSTALGTAGTEIQPSGRIDATRDGAVTALFNRLTSDGDVVQFKKDGTTFGSIGVFSSDNIYISGNSSHAGIQFGSEAIFGFKNGSLTNTLDVGNASSQWRDLYLAGGLYVGGTGTANKLDDYEEGTWTPSLSISSSGASGYYTVVGNIVHAYFKITTTTTGTNITINNFPFATKSSTPDVIGGARETETTGRFYQIQASPGNTSAYIFRYDNSNSISSGMIFQGSLIYQKA